MEEGELWEGEKREKKSYDEGEEKGIEKQRREEKKGDDSVPQLRAERKTGTVDKSRRGEKKVEETLSY